MAYDHFDVFHNCCARVMGLYTWTQYSYNTVVYYCF